jgi:hypothetical protein
MIVVTEGEIDALAMSQVQGNKWPVVSIACGADRPTDDAGNELPMTKIREVCGEAPRLLQELREGGGDVRQ